MGDVRPCDPCRASVRHEIPVQQEGRAMCPFFEKAGVSCNICCVSVGNIECASVELCTSGPFESCPIYFTDYFLGREQLAHA
jgi:hypothetical protein